MKILVTGGAGFIGSHLCEDLIQKGFSVVALDNFDPFYPVSQKEHNLSWLKQQPKFSLVRGDVRKQNNINTLFTRYKFEYVFHLAGRGGIPQSTLQPFIYLDEIMRGTMVVLEASAKNNVKIFINASSSSVYGHTRQKTSSERMGTDRPLSVYAALKKSSELLCHAYHILYGIGIVNARFFSVYGPRGRCDQIIYKIARMIDTGAPIPSIFPIRKRDFTYVEDVVAGLTSILKLNPQSYEVVNLGRGKPETINHAIKLVERALGKHALIGKKIQPMASDTVATCADQIRAQKLLKWRPRVTLEEGIPLFIKWYKENKTQGP